MNREQISGNLGSPSAEFHRQIVMVEVSEGTSGDPEITDRQRCDRSMLKKAPKGAPSRKSSSKAPISPLQSFMGKLMLSKRITRIVEDNARTPVKQHFILSTTAAETRRGSERWASASAFASDTTPTPISALSSPVPTRPMMPIPNAELPFSFPPTSSRPASSTLLDASTSATSLKLSSTQQQQDTLFDTSPDSSERTERTRSPRDSSAPTKPKRRHSTDLSLSPIRRGNNES